MKFYSSIASFYEYIFPLNTYQLSFIGEAFMNNSAVNLLDVGCAVGTLIQELDKTYSNLTGIDLDAEMIHFANKKKYIYSPEIMVGNMLELNKDFNNNCFNGIICFGNTLVHLPDRVDVKSFLRQAYNALKPEGKLLLQIINYERILENNVDALPTIDNSKVNFIRRYEYLAATDKINFITKLTLKDSSQVIDNEQYLIPITKFELMKYLQEIGFGSINNYGSFKRDVFSKDAIQLIIEATK